MSNDTSLRLGIRLADRPFHESPSVLMFYDGPVLMTLASPKHGEFLAVALSAEEGMKWPFLLAPITPDQAAAVRAGLDARKPCEPAHRGIRQHFLEAERVYLLRDYGARDLVGHLLTKPIPEDWLPSVGH